MTNCSQNFKLFIPLTVVFIIWFSICLNFFLFPFLVSHAQVPDGGPLNAHRRPRHGREHELVYLDTWKHQNVLEDMSIIKRQRKLSSYFTLQPLLKLDHGGFPQQPEHVEVEKGGAGNR